jgi:hypothetical protein
LLCTISRKSGQTIQVEVENAKKNTRANLASGKLAGLTLAEVTDLAFDSGVTLGFEGKRYRLKLEKDATFTAVLDVN